MNSPEANDYLALFARYRGDNGAFDFGRAYLEPEDDRYRLLFDQVCRLLATECPFNRELPQEFVRTARRYLRGDPATRAQMQTPQMRHFMLSDLYDFIQLRSRMGRVI